MNYFESEEYLSIREQCKESYKPFRITLGYIKYQYNQKNLKWHEAYELSGGKEVWGHHTYFIEFCWSKFPPERLRLIRDFEMKLYDISIEYIRRAVELDAIEFDKAIVNEPIPTSFSDYTTLVAIRHKIPECSSVQEAIDYANAQEFKSYIRARMIDNSPFREVWFHKDKTYSVILLRPSFRLESDGAIKFKPNRHF